MSGVDEWFNLLFGQYRLNVSEAGRLLAAGELKAETRGYDIQDLGRHALLMKAEEFGAKTFDDSRPCSLLAPVVNRSYLPTLTADRLAEPPLLIVFDTDKAAGLTASTIKPDGSVYPILVDGNHRVARRYLDGTPDEVACLVISDWDEVCKVLYDRFGRKVRAKRRRERAAA